MPCLSGKYLFVGSNDKHIYALNKQTGGIIWKAKLKSKILSSPVEFNGLVYIGAGDTIYALRAKKGGRKWKYTTGGMVNSSPIIAHGVLVVGSFDRSIYAFTFIPQ